MSENNDLRREFKVGELVRLDVNSQGGSVVEVVWQSTGKLFTCVKVPNGNVNWDVMTHRLIPIVQE